MQNDLKQLIWEKKKRNYQNENISQISTIKSQPPTKILIENCIFS